MSKSVLFVDDEPMVLNGLQRSLRAMRDDWEMAFVNSGAEALELMERRRFDIIVTDMRMPAMSGAQLLEEVKRRFPQCFRIILSGQADQDAILSVVDPAHQYLAKPCETTELKNKLIRAFSVRGLLKNEELQSVVSRLQALPSLPRLYVEVTKELEKRDPSVNMLGNLVSEDMAMTAKVLQLVNSAFFGLRCRVSSPVQAVQMLGLDTLRALVISTHVFDKFRAETFGRPETTYLWKHSFAVASCAKRMAALEGADRQTLDDCFTSGLLHDSGKLILASAMAEKYREVLKLVREEGTGLIAAERERFGCSHAEVAAYLLGLWGLPESVVEGVAWHHDPSGSTQTGFSTVIATHVASIYHEQHVAFWMRDQTPLDVEFLNQAGYAVRDEAWKHLLQQSDGCLDAM